ncbi:MAG: autotransporter assembly complex family protein [Thermodesulfobacteriota bacterium]
MSDRVFAFPWLTGLVLLVIGLCGGPVRADDLAVPYEAVIEGTAGSELVAEIKSVSDSLAFKDRPPASLILLRKRAERDVDVFRQLLRSQGYYGGRVEMDIDTAARPVRVTFRIHPGEAYVFKGMEIGQTVAAGAQELPMPRLEALGLAAGKPFRTEAFENGQKELLHHLGAKGFPFARVTERKVVVDHAEHSVSATLWVDPGPQARFGRAQIKGLQFADEAFVRQKLPFGEGDLFNTDLLGETQKVLLGMGLFSTVTVTHGEHPDEKGAVPVTIALTERKRHSVSAGLSYRTDEGPGVNFSWEDRNILGSGERLWAGASVSDLTYSADAGFRKPGFLRKDQSLLLGSRLAEDKPDAYTSLSLTNTASVDRSLSKALKVGAGAGFKRARITQLGETESFSLAFLPMHLAWDRSDDLLDPTKGGRLSLQVAPYYDLDGTHVRFLKDTLRYGHYLQIVDSPSCVLAGRIGMGLLSGEEQMRLPADERFYAGGGGSIRGYAYQTVSPLKEGVPIGGKSLLELSLETRVRITEKVGIAGFLDGGGAFRGHAPASDEDLLWGAGLGLRYFTPIGPFRLDVAVPLERREGLDDAFQVYISLGQAF